MSPEARISTRSGLSLSALIRFIMVTADGTRKKKRVLRVTIKSRKTLSQPPPGLRVRLRPRRLFIAAGTMSNPGAEVRPGVPIICGCKRLDSGETMADVGTTASTGVNDLHGFRTVTPWFPHGHGNRHRHVLPVPRFRDEVLPCRHRTRPQSPIADTAPGYAEHMAGRTDGCPRVRTSGDSAGGPPGS